MTVPGFPNFFMLYGPEHQRRRDRLAASSARPSTWSRRSKRLVRTGSTAVEVRPGFYDAYNRWIDRQMRGHGVGGLQQLLQGADRAAS